MFSYQIFSPLQLEMPKCEKYLKQQKTLRYFLNTDYRPQV